MFTAANGDRPGVPNVAVIIVFGQSNSAYVNQTVVDAMAARADGISFIVVGIADVNTPLAEWVAIASTGATSLSNIFIYQDFTQLSDPEALAEFQTGECNGETRACVCVTRNNYRRAIAAAYC